MLGACNTCFFFVLIILLVYFLVCLYGCLYLFVVAAGGRRGKCMWLLVYLFIYLFSFGVAASGSFVLFLFFRKGLGVSKEKLFIILYIQNIFFTIFKFFLHVLHVSAFTSFCLCVFVCAQMRGCTVVCELLFIKCSFKGLQTITARIFCEFHFPYNKEERLTSYSFFRERKLYSKTYKPAEGTL